MSIDIYKGNILFTPNSKEFKSIKNGYIVVEDNKVKDVYETLPVEYSDLSIVDYKDSLIIPGMNDLHCHAPQFRNLGLAMDKELIPWLNQYTFPEESKYVDSQYAKDNYKRFVAELIKQGTTRVAAFATIHKEATTVLIDILKESGMGAYVGKVNMNRNCHEDLLEDLECSINDTLDLISSFGDDGIVHPILTPRFIPTCCDDMLKKLGDIAIKQNIPVQSHLSENLSEIEWVKELHPKSKFYGDAYNNFNLFGQTKTLMAHCVHSSDEEIALMKQNGVFAVHCPTSNGNLASGIMSIRRFLDNDAKVAFGSDISGGHSLSMFKVIVYAIQLSKLKWVESNKELDFLTLPEAFYIATKGGGEFFGKVGSFEPGFEFDALVIDDSDINYSDYSIEERLERFIYIGDDRNIQHRYVSGQLLK